MTLWSLYFIAKAWLHFRGYMRVDLVWNLAFFFALLIPVPARFDKPWLRRLRMAAALTAAVLLVWRDSWLPSLKASLSFAAKPGSPIDPVYLARFVMGLFPAGELAALAVLLGLLWALARRLRLQTAPVAFFALLATLLKTTAAPGDWAGHLKEFHRAEASRRVDLGRGAPAADFDIVFLHACSFGWDDIGASKVGRLGFLEDMDLVYSDFNSATAYSGPSMARLLNAACGQLPHAALYQGIPAECSLMEGLRKRGYSVVSALNHPGVSRDFAKEIASLGRGPAPIMTDDLPAMFLNFDGAPIRSDREVLERWWSARLKDGSPREALYYNSITTHGGSHRADEADWWKKSKDRLWPEAAQAMSEGLSAFFKTLESSGRSVMVVFVGEHGMAYRPSPMQGVELRDIPLPRTTLVPAGIKFIGPAFASVRRPRRVEGRPASYLALAQAVSDALAGREVSAPPAQEFVSENERAVVARFEGKWLYRDETGAWSALPAGEERVVVP